MSKDLLPNDQMIILVHKVYEDLGIPVPDSVEDLVKDEGAMLKHIGVYSIILEEIGVCVPEGEE